jgi:fatty-acyl-CoA synthase
LQVLEAAVIAMPNERWGERPLLIVVPKQGAGEGAAQDQLQWPARISAPEHPVLNIIIDTAAGRLLSTLTYDSAGEAAAAAAFA